MQNIKERQEFENYNKIKLLGEGSFGKAFLVERASDKLKCVMKQIDISKMSDNERKETVKEAKILEVLSHPNIVKFIEVFKTKNGKLCIVMDFADGGDLQNRIKEQRGRAFTESQVLEWFTQICLGLKHIHDRKILHRDLKGQNIFLTSKGIIKIGDFGIAKVLASTMQNARTVVGTPYYLSPEIVQSKPYNFKSDMWSMGVILYELCALKPPFDAPSLHFLAMKIVRGAFNPLPSGFSSEMKSLVGQLLTTNERNRPDVNKVLNMPIMQNRIKVFLTETIYNKEFSHTILHKQNVFDPKGLPQNNLVAQAAGKLLPPVIPQKQDYKSPIALPTPPSNQVVPRYNPGGVVRPQVNQTPVPPQRQAVTPIQGNQYQINKNAVSPGMAAAFGGSPKQNPPRPQQYGAPNNNNPGQAPKLNYHYQNQQQNNPSPNPLGLAPSNILRPQSALPSAPQNGQQQIQAKQQIEANIAKAKAYEQHKLAQVQALAQVEAKAKHEALVAQEQAKLQKQANAVADAKRAEDERQHKEKMKAIEERLRQKELELKKMDEVKKERDRKAAEEKAKEAGKQKEVEEQARRQLEQAKKDRERRAIEEAQDMARVKKMKEKEQEEVKKRQMQEEQARKLQEAHLKRKEETEQLKRDEIQRRQREEQRKKEELRKEQAKVISDRIEKQVEKAKTPSTPQTPSTPAAKEGTDINMVVKMAAQNVANNISNIERKINNAQSPNPKDNVSPLIPPIHGHRVQQSQLQVVPDPKQRLIIAPQSCKNQQQQNAYKEPPQSARVNHTAQDWNKKPNKIQETQQSSRPTTAQSKLTDSPSEKIKKEIESKKIREEGMKKWREKWAEREQKNVVVGIIPTEQPKTRNIEMVKGKQIAQTAMNVKQTSHHDENKGIMDGVMIQKASQVERKIEVGNILKERSPQPQKISPKKEILEVIQQAKPKSPVIERTSIGHHEEIKQSHTPTKTSIRSGNHSKNHSPHTSAKHFSPAQTVEEYNEVYRMLEEMAGIVKMNLDNPQQSSDEEEKKKGEESDDEDDSDDDFGTDRDINWADARQRRKSKSPLRGGHKKAADIQKKVDEVPKEEVMTFENCSPLNEEEPSQKQYFDHTLQTILEAGSEAENTLANSKKRDTLPSNGQDTQKESSDEDRDDDIDEPSTSANETDQQQVSHSFTFMGNDDANAAFEEISKFTSVEQYREFLEKELGEDRLMKAYPLLKEFGDRILYFDKTTELEAILKDILTVKEIKKYQPHFATWIFMELQAETTDEQTGVKLGADNAMKTLKNINMTAQFGKLI